MDTAAKYITIIALSICAGFFIATYALTNNTSHVKQRTCDDINVRRNYYSKKDDIVCEIELQAEDDNITILEYK